MYAANIYLLIGAIGLITTVVVYEPIGELAYDYFRGQDSSRKGASVEPVQEQQEKDGSQRSSGVGEAGDRLLLGDADEDETDVTKASSAKDDLGRDKSEKEQGITTTEASPRASVMLAGTAVDEFRKSLTAFNKVSVIYTVYEEMPLCPCTPFER